MSENPYRALPSVDRLLARDDVRAAGDAAADLVRQALESAREAIATGREAPSEDEIAEQIAGLAQLVLEPSLRRVINASGVIVHTNLGRAPLSEAAIEAMALVAKGYSNLEFDLGEGERGSRYTHLEPALRQLTGAEAAIAVNNNASALLLVLSVFAEQRAQDEAPREVIISRGQAVEIGGGFRIPDVMAQSGVRLVEVGTTNRTYLRDYERAITPQTAAIMRVHTSNFRVVGFTKAPSLQDLGRVAHEHGLALLDDLGSGCLLETAQFGLAAEPTVAQSLAAGADVCMFSGDKLLGGPQAGIIAGRGDLVEAARRHPLARAVRLDKTTIAGLHATLLHYLRGEALTEVPVWRMIAAPVAEIEARAKRWRRSLGSRAKVVEGRSMVGGGSLPEESLPTKLVSIASKGASKGAWVTDLARRLRAGEPPVVGRIESDALLLDPRTVAAAEDDGLVAAVKRALALREPQGER
ncbi:MAG: L-seryl-tRNA(Sec) selenium transferase [Chloroflexi bacterium]|nr:L-seryl-tRNA(Sec) selenium transferase [Chloroflexota bacterium]